MRFNKIYIPRNLALSKGIAEISIGRLSNMIVFVGKNGSGKTRILDLIQEHSFDSLSGFNLTSGFISHLDETLIKIKKQLMPFEEIINQNEEYLKIQNKLKNTPDDKELLKQLEIIELNIGSRYLSVNEENIINTSLAELNIHNKFLQKKYIKRIYSTDIQQLQYLIEQNNQNSFESLVENLDDNFEFDELKSINKASLSYLIKLPHQLASDKYECIANDDNFEERTSYKRFYSLKRFIKIFLNKELTWVQESSRGNLTEKGNVVTFAGVWKLDERNFNYNELSDGEKTLFAYALLFFLLDQNPNLNLKEGIILIDEPELHLHPDSEIDLIESLKKVVEDKGQLIIATHSINILSTLNYDEIFMVKNGVITHPTSNTPSESLSELMGLEDRIHKLTDFLTSISTWSYVNFMAQCFSNPEVIESAKENDPQIENFKDIVKNHMNKNSNMLLDFGAGKGRVLEQIKKDYSFMTKISYSALEPDLEFHEQLKNLGTKDIYISHNNLPKNSFDFILLCNVLHEIPINDWEESLNKIIDSLTPEGYLIIIEAKTLSKGEKIGNIGYLLLDLEEIKELFDLKDLPSSLKVQKNIICTILNKRELKNISKQNIIKCLTALEKNTFDKLEIIRNDNLEVNHLYSIGRNSAFLSQQHINAKFAIKHIQNN